MGWGRRAAGSGSESGSVKGGNIDGEWDKDNDGVAVPGNDAGSGNELDERAALIPKSAPGTTGFGASTASEKGVSGGAIAPEIVTAELPPGEEKVDEGLDSDDEEALELQKRKEQEDPIFRNLKNAVDLYDAIQVWKKQPSDSYAYKHQAIAIMDKFLSDPVETEIDLNPTEDIEGYEELYDLSGYFSDESDDTVIAEEKAPTKPRDFAEP